MESFAIIGSGLAGLTLANLLNKKNKVLVFDKSRGVGGRLATRRNGEYFLSRLKKIGLQSFVNEDKFKSLPMLKSVLIPDRFNDKEFREKLLKNHNLEIGGGLGPTKGKIWRFGLMGFNSRKELIDNLFDTLEIYIN